MPTRFSGILAIVIAAFFLASPTLAGNKAATTAEKPKPYTEIVLDPASSDAEAVKIAQKIMAKDIAAAKKMMPSAPEARVYAKFVSLGPNLPKTSIAAMLDHAAWCGSSGCRTAVLQPTGKNNTYRPVFDTTLGRIFLSTRPGKTYSDILVIVSPRATEGFGVWFWDDKKQNYYFAGISRFAKK